MLHTSIKKPYLNKKNFFYKRTVINYSHLQMGNCSLEMFSNSAKIIHQWEVGSGIQFSFA